MKYAFHQLETQRRHSRLFPVRLNFPPDNQSNEFSGKDRISGCLSVLPLRLRKHHNCVKLTLQHRIKIYVFHGTRGRVFFRHYCICLTGAFLHVPGKQEPGNSHEYGTG